MFFTYLGTDIMEKQQGTKKNRKYNEATLRTAVENVLKKNMTVYRASKEYAIPWTTLKDNVRRAKEEGDKGIESQFTMSKIGRPFSLPVELEQKLVAYIIEMQELGFGLTVNQIRKLAFSLAEAKNPKHCFSTDKGFAGWNWWVSFKQRYGLSLRTPENLSAGRASCSNPAILADFYEKLEKTLVEHDLLESPDKIWNCDETGLMFVNKPSKIVSKIGKQYVYNRTYAEKGTTTTVLAAINASGCFLPPMTIFKGVRNIPELSSGSLPNSLTRLSPKGWINADLFLEWLVFFSKNIPPARPVLLIMDSHASHVSPNVLAYAQSNKIILFTMPAHTSHILQPLDVGVFRPLKAAWRAELQKYKTQHPSSVPTRFDFHKFLTPAYERSFTSSNIRAGFEKTGIYPLNKTAVCPEAIAPSRLTDKPLPVEPMQQVLIEEDLEDSIPITKIDTTNSDPLNDLSSQEPKQEFTTNIATQATSNKGSCVTKADSNVANSSPPKPKKIEILDILILPKWIPKANKQSSKRTVPKAIYV